MAAGEGERVKAKAGAIRVNVQVADWTRGSDGRSNSSENYLRLVEHVERLIRSDAWNLVNGSVENTARLVVSHLAHRHGVMLTRDIADPSEPDPDGD